MTLTVANTILQQLGGQRFIVMTGARNLLGDGNSLAFKVGANVGGVTHVRIELTPADLYNVRFLRVRGTSVRTLAEVDGVYADNLRATFTEQTGLATSL